MLNPLLPNRVQQKRLPARQRGAAFVLLLIVVVVIMATTMITLGTVNESNLQIMIARNIAEKQASLRNADAAVGLAEEAWSTQVTTCFENIAACTLDFSPLYKGDHTTTTGYWTGAAVATNQGMNYGKNQIEYFGARPVPGDTERVIHFYRVTGIAYEEPMSASGTAPTSAKSPTVVQTMMRICTRADGSGTC